VPRRGASLKTPEISRHPQTDPPGLRCIARPTRPQGSLPVRIDVFGPDREPPTPLRSKGSEGLLAVAAKPFQDRPLGGQSAGGPRMGNALEEPVETMVLSSDLEAEDPLARCGKEAGGRKDAANPLTPLQPMKAGHGQHRRVELPPEDSSDPALHVAAEVNDL